MKPPHEELGELVNGQGASRRREVTVELAHRSDARSRGSDDCFKAGEDLRKAASEPGRLLGVAAVEVHLATARLPVGEDDVVPEALEEGDRRARGVRNIASATHVTKRAMRTLTPPVPAACRLRSRAFVRALDGPGPALVREALGEASGAECLDRIPFDSERPP